MPISMGSTNSFAPFFGNLERGPLKETNDAVKAPSAMTNLTIFYTPYSMAEEFVGVYRMRHPLLPAELEDEARRCHYMTYHSKMRNSNKNLFSEKISLRIVRPICSWAWDGEERWN